MYPLYWTPSKEGIFMCYSHEYKLECIELYRKGIWPETPEGIKTLNFHDDNADTIYEELDKGTLDFRLVLVRTIPSKYQTLLLLKQDQRGVLVLKDHPLSSLKQVTVKDIVAYPLIVSSQSDVDKTSLGNHNYKIVATYNLLYTASRLVQAGVGIAICTNGIIDNPNLAFIPFSTVSEEKFYLIWRDQHDQTATEKAFLEEIEAQLYEVEN